MDLTIFGIVTKLRPETNQASELLISVVRFTAEDRTGPERNTTTMKQTFFARRSLLILMILMFSLSFIWMGTRRALQANRNDVKKWLPDGFQETLDHAWFEAHFPHEQFILASWEGCTLNDPLLEKLAVKLENSKDGQTATNPPWFKNVITGKRLIDQLLESHKQRGMTYEDALKRLRGTIIGDDNQKTCLVVTLADAYHGQELAAVVQRVKDLAYETGIKPDTLHLGGPPVDNAAIDYEGKRTLIRLAGWSAVIGLGLAWLCFRSLRLTSLIFTCAILAAGIGLAIVFFTGGMVDAILLSMPSLVYVLAMSGAIHIINYYHDAIREGGLTGAPERALAHGWKPCTIAAITTGLGLISLCSSALLPIRNFGFYSTLGVLATLVLLFLVLPACLQIWPSQKFAMTVLKDRREGRETQESMILNFWRKFGSFIITKNSWVVVSGVLVMVFFGFGIEMIKTDIKLMKFFSPGTRILVDYGWLEKQIGPLVPMEVVVRVDRDKCKLSFAEKMRMAREIERQMESLPEVGGALSAATLAPDLGAHKLYYSAADSVLSKRLEKHRDEFSEFLQVDENTNEELWRISGRVEALGDLDYGAFVSDIEKKVNPVVDYYKQNGIKGLSITYTGLVPLVYKAQTELLSGLFNSLVLAFVLIAIVMMIVLRSFSAGLLSMVPNLFPVVVIFGAMGWYGELVDVGTMMTASVALGVAVDDTIHYLSWFRHGLDIGYNRKGAAMLAYERCATAMTQTTLIAGFGLAVFALSTFTPTQRFGYMMLALLMAALIGDLVLLPALLAGPFGRFFDKKLGTKDHPLLSPGGGMTLSNPHATPHEPTESHEPAETTTSAQEDVESTPDKQYEPERELVKPRRRVEVSQQVNKVS